MQNSIYRTLYRALTFGGILVLVAGGTRSANAQFAGFTGYSRYDATTKAGNVGYGSFSYFPVAVFQSGGSFGNGAVGTRSDFGSLVSGDFGLKLAKTTSALELGGWYWTKGSSDLYQIQGRAYFTRELGLQVSYLSSTSTSGNAWATYLLYDLSSLKFGRKVRPRWGIKTGIGLFQDVSAGSPKPTNLTYFISGSIEVAPRVSINASTWYLRDRSADLTRLAVGLGYSF